MTANRRFHEAITSLPGDRSTVYSRHHLFWTGADINAIGLSDFRGLACTSARHMDSMVHSLVHERFAGVVNLRSPDTQRDLKRRVRRYLSRHESRRCSCFDTKRFVIIDPLSLEHIHERAFDRPPCLGMAVDCEIYGLMRDYYAAVAPITDQIRVDLESRHRGRQCGCYIQSGSSKLFRPELHRLIPSLAA